MGEGGGEGGERGIFLFLLHLQTTGQFHAVRQSPGEGLRLRGDWAKPP